MMRQYLHAIQHYFVSRVDNSLHNFFLFGRSTLDLQRDAVANVDTNQLHLQCNLNGINISPHNNKLPY